MTATIEYRTKDKSDWGTGSWQEEPDKKQWRDEATGLPCLIVRNHSGALCGYVGVPPEHRLYQSSYDADGVDVEVHGGLTFASLCAPTLTHEAWEKWRASVYAGRAEAERFPEGDAARRLKENAEALENYEIAVANREAQAICHIPSEGEPDHVWWFGFDCAHYMDFSPAYAKRYGDRESNDEMYRDFEYVTAEVTNLASQLAALTHRLG